MNIDNSTIQTVLRMIGEANRGGEPRKMGLFRCYDDLLEEFGDNQQLLDGILTNLQREGFVREVSEKFRRLNNRELGYPAYQLTELGKTKISTQTVQSTVISNNSGSNIAYQSPGAVQGVNIDEFPEEIKQMVDDFYQAVQQKNASNMKKAFTYIADKAVDVAIAIVTGALIR